MPQPPLADNILKPKCVWDLLILKSLNFEK